MDPLIHELLAIQRASAAQAAASPSSPVPPVLTEEQQRHVYKTLAALPLAVVAGVLSNGVDPLEHLDVGQMSVAFLVILNARFQQALAQAAAAAGAGASAGVATSSVTVAVAGTSASASASASVAARATLVRLLATARRFALGFDARQLSVCAGASTGVAAGASGSELTLLGEHVVAAAEAQRSAAVGVAVLQPLVARLNDAVVAGAAAVHITPLHVMLLRLALLAKNYAVAVRAIDFAILAPSSSINNHNLEQHSSLALGICDVASPVAPTRVLDVLLFYYYGGLALIGAKRFRDALHFFDVCLCVPSIVPSAVQIEAYKHHLLVALLLYGDVVPLQKSVSPCVARACRAHTFHYSEFATAFSSLNHARALAKANQFAEKFIADKTVGLINQCLSDIVRRKIKQLTTTYLTLSLSDIAKSVGITEADADKQAEDHVLHMITKKSVFASISHADRGMVSFNDQTETFDSIATTLRLEREIRSISTIEMETRELNRKIGLSRGYLQKSVEPIRSQSINLDEEIV